MVCVVIEYEHLASHSKSIYSARSMIELVHVLKLTHLLSISTATLTVNATVACPNDTIIFTCSLPGDNVTWEVYTPPAFGITENTLRLVMSEAQPTMTSADLRLEGAVTDFSGGRITATLTVISFGYGTTVACIGQDTLSSADILTTGKLLQLFYCHET